MVLVLGCSWAVLCMCLLAISFVSSVHSPPGLSAGRRSESTELHRRAPQNEPTYDLGVESQMRIRPFGQPPSPAAPSPGTNSPSPVPRPKNQPQSGSAKTGDPKPKPRPNTTLQQSPSNQGRFPADLRRQCVPGRYAGSSEPRRVSSSGPPATRKGNGSKAPALARRQQTSCAGYLANPPSLRSWENLQTTPWLQDWWRKRSADIKRTQGGFVGLFRQEFLRDPTSTCSLDSGENCDFDKCDQATLAGVSVCDRQQAYHVLLAIRNVQTYFKQYLNALKTAATSAALTKDNAAATFFADGRYQDYGQFKMYASIANFIFGLLGPAAPVIKEVVPWIGFSDAVFFFPPHLFANIQVLTLSSVGTLPDDTPRVAAELGQFVEAIFWKIMGVFSSGYERLMQGGEFAKTNFVEWVESGAWANFNGFPPNALENQMRAQVNAWIIDRIWRAQRIMILGGMGCEESPDLGRGPLEGWHCVDGKSWFLISLQSSDQGYALWSPRRWGYTAAPAGMDQLGKGAYEGITHRDVIASSVGIWQTAKGNKLTPKVVEERFMKMLESPSGRLSVNEGSTTYSFTIPVCDISQATDLPHHEKILQPYNRDSKVTWCGPICSNSWEKTTEFYKAAHVWGYQPIIHGCHMEPPWGREKVSFWDKFNSDWWFANPSVRGATDFWFFNDEMPWE